MLIKCSALILIISSSLVFVTTSTPFDFDELVEIINKNFKYLEQKGNLSTNASFILAWGVGELYIAQTTVPDMEIHHMKEIKNLIPKYDGFIKKALEDNPKDLAIQLLYHPDRWGLTGDYRFKKGRIPEGDPLDESLHEIYKRSIPKDEDIKCLSELINKNKGSDVPRLCEVPCQDIMNDDNFTAGVAVDERISYITVEALINCSNQTPKKRLEIVADFCNFTKQQINTMYERRYEAEFEGLKYFYMNKLLLCGTYGFPEFYSDEYIGEIIGYVNNDGSVGTQDHSEEDRKVMTSQVAAILASVIRLVLEDLHNDPNCLKEA